MEVKLRLSFTKMVVVGDAKIKFNDQPLALVRGGSTNTNVCNVYFTINTSNYCTSRSSHNRQELICKSWEKTWRSASTSNHSRLLNLGPPESCFTESCLLSGKNTLSIVLKLGDSYHLDMVQLKLILKTPIEQCYHKTILEGFKLKPS